MDSSPQAVAVATRRLRQKLDATGLRWAPVLRWYQQTRRPRTAPRPCSRALMLGGLVTLRARLPDSAGSRRDPGRAPPPRRSRATRRRSPRRRATADAPRPKAAGEAGQAGRASAATLRRRRRGRRRTDRDLDARRRRERRHARRDARAGRAAPRRQPAPQRIVPKRRSHDRAGARRRPRAERGRRRRPRPPRRRPPDQRPGAREHARADRRPPRPPHRAAPRPGTGGGGDDDDPGSGASSARGPGRVNLIGEHTDYNGGLALPFAIDRGVTVTAEPLDGDRIEAEASDLGERDAFPLADPGPAEGWRAFVRGTVAELTAAGIELAPARLRFTGDVPQGSGLSSSAALEAALSPRAARRGRRPRARPARAGEAVLAGRERLGRRRDRACSTRSPRCSARRATRCGSTSPRWRSSRSRSTSAAGSSSPPSRAPRTRTPPRATTSAARSAEAAARELGVEHLSAADPEAVERLADPLRRRARHVLSENRRVDATIDGAGRRATSSAVGRLLDASHASLRDDYEASVPEVEATVERLKRAGAAGARMMGGGFGGAVLALLRPGCPRPDGAVAVVPGPAAAPPLTRRAGPRAAARTPRPGTAGRRRASRGRRTG